MEPLTERQLDVIRKYPLKSHLNSFRSAFQSTHPRTSFRKLDGFEKIVSDDAGEALALQLVITFQTHPAARLLPSHGQDNGTLVTDIASLYARLSNGETNIKHAAGLLRDVVADKDDPTIWATVYKLIGDTKPSSSAISSHRQARPTTPPQSAHSHSFQETPTVFRSGSSVLTSELRKDIDPLLEDEVQRNLILDHPGIFNAFYGRVAQLTDVSEAVFNACKSSNPPTYNEGTGWKDWPSNCSENEVVLFLRGRVDHFLTAAKDDGFIPAQHRRFIARPSLPLGGSMAKRKLDVGIASGISDDSENMPWSQVLIPGELKSNPSDNNSSRTHFDLAKYAREVFASQDTRRFVLGFTLCGSLMRLWEFDRLGCVGSTSFDIQTDGRRFVSVVLGWLWMNEQELGFDPTISEDDDGNKYLQIQRTGRSERIRLEKVIRRQRAIVGRATTCWEGKIDGNSDDNSEGGSDGSPESVVVKDSWEYEDRPEEGPLLQDATAAGVDHIARYYHHETVHVWGVADDVIGNIRKELGAGGRRPSQPDASQVTATPTSGSSHQKSRGGSRSSSGTLKRPSSQALLSMLPPAKRSRSNRSIQADPQPLSNRVHRRVIMRDVGKSLYSAKSLEALVTGLLGGLKGHESLVVKASILHRDISIGNVMLNEAEDDGFLIDHDLAIKLGRREASGAPSKTGTKVFMAIGALKGEAHLNVHDKESFFWLLLWISSHWNGPGKSLTKCPTYDQWNLMETVALAKQKIGVVNEEDGFADELKVTLTAFCKPLLPSLQELRTIVFPGGSRRRGEDPALYRQMVAVLEKARQSV